VLVLINPGASQDISQVTQGDTNVYLPLGQKSQDSLDLQVVTQTITILTYRFQRFLAIHCEGSIKTYQPATPSLLPRTQKSKGPPGFTSSNPSFNQYNNDLKGSTRAVSLCTINQYQQLELRLIFDRTIIRDQPK
jgi:hypothetical protein